MAHSEPCRAYEGERCPNDADTVVDGLELCAHHAAKADINDYPRPDPEASEVTA